VILLGLRLRLRLGLRLSLRLRDGHRLDLGLRLGLRRGLGVRHLGRLRLAGRVRPDRLLPVPVLDRVALGLAALALFPPAPDGHAVFSDACR
jgi:hypothetical protein